MTCVSGESARQKAEQLRAFGDVAADAWLAGAEGERRVAEALSALPSTWTAVHDRLLMPGVTESNLDHLLVGPAGVILIDAKNFSGDITIWRESLYQHLGAGERRSSRNLIGELRKVHWMTHQVSTRIAVPVTPVLCLAGSRQASFGEPVLVSGVWVVPLDTLVSWLVARPTIVDGEGTRRLLPRVLSEFPSTQTDPELLAAIGRELGKITPARSGSRRGRSGPPSRARAHARPPVRRRGRGALGGLIRLVLAAAIVLFGVQNLGPISQWFGEMFGTAFTPSTTRSPADILAVPEEPAAQSAPVTVAPAEQPAAAPPSTDDIPCEALSEERLSTYLKVPVHAWHGMDGTCMWYLDRQDTDSLVLIVRHLSASHVAHLQGNTVSLGPSASLSPPGPTSVLLAREGQWIPVADTRTEARWPMRAEIFRGRLGIDDHRGQQILRAVAADLSATTQP